MHLRHPVHSSSTRIFEYFFGALVGGVHSARRNSQQSALQLMYIVHLNSGLTSENFNLPLLAGFKVQIEILTCQLYSRCI